MFGKLHYKILSNRQLQVGEIIKGALSELLKFSKFDLALYDISVTVSEVRMSKDLKIANCYVLPFAGKISEEELINILNASKGAIRYELNKKIKLKFSPELKFFYDDSFDKVHKLNGLMKSDNDNQSD